MEDSVFRHSVGSTELAASLKRARQQPQMIVDPEVSDLHDQIDEVEEKISRLQSDVKTRTALYESEIARIQSEIDKKKVDVETQLSLIRQQQAEELAALHEQQELELAELRERLADARVQKDTFAQRHNEVVRANKEAEIAALKNELERRIISHRNKSFVATTNTQQDKMEQQQREAEVQAQIEILDAEINEIAASRNEELQRARVKMDETCAIFEARQKEQQVKVDRYKDEIAKRKQQYEEQVAALEAQKKMEHDQLDNELKATNEKVQALQQLFAKMDRRNSREIQMTQQDIERLRSAIQQGKEREEAQLVEAREQVAQLQDAQRDNVAIEQELMSIREEIARIKEDNAEMRSERQRMDTKIYSTRISKHRSTLR